MFPDGFNALNKVGTITSNNTETNTNKKKTEKIIDEKINKKSEKVLKRDSSVLNSSKDLSGRDISVKKFISKKGNKYVGPRLDGKPEGDGTLTYVNGDKYEGPFVKGEPHGECGTLTYKNGNVYLGPFVEGKPGQWEKCTQKGDSTSYQIIEGTLTYANGDTYKGPLVKGEPHGECGTLTYENGNVYRGPFVEGKPHGEKGRLTYENSDSNRAIYEGSFEEGEPHGEGIYEDTKIDYVSSHHYYETHKYKGKFDHGKLLNGTIESFFWNPRYGKKYKFKYEGEFDTRDSERWFTYESHGKGKLILQQYNENYALINIRTYEGDFKHGYFIRGRVTSHLENYTIDYSDYSYSDNTGIGKKVNKHGVYEGPLVDGCLQGEGRWTSKHNFIFEGNFKKDVFDGKGIVTTEYFVYEGEYPTGKGKKTIKNGDIEKGDFVALQLHGKGKTFHKEAGMVIEAEYVNGLPHGKGTITYDDSEKFEGTFLMGSIETGTFTRKDGVYKGKFVDNKLEGKGVVNYINGDKFEGIFVKGKPSQGKLIYENGEIYEGSFTNGKPSQGKLIYENGEIYEGSFTNGKPPSKFCTIL